VPDNRLATLFASDAALVGGEAAAMMFTDPPGYGAIGMAANPCHPQRTGRFSDALGKADVAVFLLAFAELAVPLVASDCYWVMGCERWPQIDTALRNAGLHWSATVIRLKDIFVLVCSTYHRRDEPIWYGWPVPGNSAFHGERSQGDGWEVPRFRVSEDHPTQKPAVLYGRAISNSSEPGEIVLDPFLGSRTAILAADLLRTGAAGFELPPTRETTGFVGVILDRLTRAGFAPHVHDEWAG
jgi:DNA modification methylase